MKSDNKKTEVVFFGFIDVQSNVYVSFNLQVGIKQLQYQHILQLHRDTL